MPDPADTHAIIAWYDPNSITRSGTTAALPSHVARNTLDALAEGRTRRRWLTEALAYDFCTELFRTKRLCDLTYARAIGKFGECGVIDMLGVVGYFVTVSMVMNVAPSLLGGIGDRERCPQMHEPGPEKGMPPARIRSHLRLRTCERPRR